MTAAIIPFTRNTAYARALARWQAQARDILGRADATWSQRRLAHRFLQIHGLL